MDTNMIDRLNRSVANASSRRQLFKVVGGAAVGSLALASGVHRVTAQTGGNTNIIPIEFTDGVLTFVGQFEIDRFVFRRGQVLAVGDLTGTVTDALGEVVGNISQQLTLPVLDSSSGTCQILNLDLGPLDLNLLGLRIELSAIELDITAIPGGGLLGDLLCAIANLLNGPNAVGRRLADLLNQLLGAL